MKRYYVYLYLRSADSRSGAKGSPYYVGKGQGRRDVKFSHNVTLPKDRANIIRVAEGMSEPDAFQAEMLLIYLYGRIDRNTGCLRNRTDGGEGPSGIIRTDEHRRRLAESLRNASGEARQNWSNAQRNKSEQHRQRIASALRGKKMPESVKEKLRAANLGKKPSAETLQKRSEALRGRSTGPFSEERRRKIGEAGRGRKHTEEAKRKIAAASLGRKHSDETRERMSAERKQWFLEGRNTSGLRKKKVSEG